jgi:2-haloacid dehalogenase
MGSNLGLKAWPDVEPALGALRREGVGLALLSNATPGILGVCLVNWGLRWAFDRVLSTDQLKTFKPDPRADQNGVDAFARDRREIAWVAFAGWDAAGAKWFGYPTYWANRMMAPAECLGAAPNATGRDLSGLAGFLRAGAPGRSKGEPIAR